MDPVQRWTLEVAYRAFENGQWGGINGTVMLANVWV